MTNILAINGSYRDNGITDQTVEAMVAAAKAAGARVETVVLRDYPIEFCLNCRECTQQPGEKPGKCVQEDGMHDLIKKIEEADSYILASPTNFGSVTALFARFIERLTVYAYWPWDMNAPQSRKKNTPKKKAVLVSSCAAPGLLGRLVYGTHKQLKQTAAVIGANAVGSIFTGLIAKDKHPNLPEHIKKKASSKVVKLM